MALAARSFIDGRTSMADSFVLAFNPFDSVRYFEFEIIWNWLRRADLGDRYLDVSSPRLFFLLLLKFYPKLHASLINPDEKDLAITRNWIHKFGLEERASLFNCLLEDATLPHDRFQTITSISVIEHIPGPDDVAILKKFWQLLRPGGRLFISVPCAAEAFEEYLNFNEYGVLKSGQDGYVFGQRFYDEALLESRIYDVIGPPSRTRVFGERRAGVSAADRARKVRGGIYPFWRESLTMGKEYCYFERIREMPGVGVVAMEFVKSQES